MAIKITLKNSVVQDSVPTTSHLAAVGELALNANINSLGIYMRASDNSIVKMAGPGSLTTPAASTTAAGIAELATSAETTTGTDTARVTTPAGVKAVTDAERTTSNNTYLALAGGTLTGVVAATAGSNSAPAIHFGDTDSGIYGGTNTVSLAAGGTQGLTLDSSAEVEIPTKLAISGAGKLSPLNVRGMTDGNLHIRAITDIHSGTGVGLDVLNDANNTVKDLAIRAANTVFKNASSESARLDSSGRLLVGLTSSRAIANLTTLQQIEGTDAASGLSITRNSASNEGGTLNFGKSRAAGLGGVTVIQDGDALGTINFSGADGTDLTNTAASIAGFINGTPGANDTPGKLVFGTTADGATSPTTRLTITSAGLVNVPDNGEFTAGASGDLALLHNGTNSHIHSKTGELDIRSDNFHLRNAANNEDMIVADNGAGVGLFHDNSKKFETHSGGITVTGKLNFDSDNYIDCNTTANTLEIFLDGGQVGEFGSTSLRLLDNKILKLGTGNDLQIYHDGSNSYIQDTGTGALRFQTNEFAVYNAAGDEWLFKAEENGANLLKYDNSTKLATSANGVEIENGDLRINADAKILNDNRKLYFGAGNDLQIYHDGTNSHISNTTGSLIFSQPNSNNTTLYANGILSIYANASSDYGIHMHNDGNDTNRYGLRITCGTDDATGTNVALAVRDGNGTIQGYLTFSGGTLALDPFTAAHPCIVPDADNPSDESMAYPYGTLLETTAIEYKKKKDGSDTERGILYKVQKTQSANSKKVLGAYAGSLNNGPDNYTNMHHAYVLGDGHILCNNAGGNIEVGDGICSSATAGIGQKATANPSMIIGIAQEAITFTGSETKLVAVQYGLQQFIPWT